MTDDLRTDSISFYLIVANVVVWILGLIQPKAPFLSAFPITVETGGIYLPAVMAGQWWRLITAMFIHDGPVHLASNMLGLFALGSMLERMLGKKRFLIVYFLSGIGGNIFVLLADSFRAISHYTIGASGAVLGMLGALLAISVKGRKKTGRSYTKRVLFACILMLIPSTPNVSLSAHFGGLLSGFAVTFILLFLNKTEAEP